MKFYYMGLEPYNDRYTLQLTDWTRELAKQHCEITEFIEVKGTIIATEVRVGQVLDAYGRAHYSTTQIASLVQMLQAGTATNKDVIFFEDMFTPGIESLAYIFCQVPASERPRVFVRCLAQTIDPDDFVHKTGMAPWMRKYEQMVNTFVDGIILSSEEMIGYAQAAGWPMHKCYNIGGLTFNTDEVHSRVDQIKPFSDRPYTVAFSSRWDDEKQPLFYLEVARVFSELHPEMNAKFVVYQGGPVKSNNKDNLRALANSKYVTAYPNLPKNEYYRLLAEETRVVFNCALQDWVSNTVAEADALGCNVVFPAYRSFPEVLKNDHMRMYVPWSVEDAVYKLYNALASAQWSQREVSRFATEAFSRIMAVITVGAGKASNNREHARLGAHGRDYTT